MTRPRYSSGKVMVALTNLSASQYSFILEGSVHLDIRFKELRSTNTRMGHVRKQSWIRHNLLLSIRPNNLCRHSRLRNDNALSMLLSQPILEDGTMQAPQETQSPTRPQGLGMVLLQRHATVVEHELGDTVGQGRVVALVGGEGGDEDHGLRFLETRVGLDLVLGADFGECVAEFGILDLLHARVEVDVSDLAGSDDFLWYCVWILDTDLSNGILHTCSERYDIITGLDGSVKDTNKANDTSEIVIPRIHQEHLQRLLLIANRRRNVINHSRQNRRNTLPRLRAQQDGSLGIQLEAILQLFQHPGHIGRIHIDLVDHGHESQVLRKGEVEVGHGLGLDALRGVDEEEGAAAAGVGAGDFGTEVDVAGRVDEVEEVVFAFVLPDHGAGLGFDGDASLTFDVEFILAPPSQLRYSSMGKAVKYVQESVYSHRSPKSSPSAPTTDHSTYSSHDRYAPQYRSCDSGQLESPRSSSPAPQASVS